MNTKPLEMMRRTLKTYRALSQPDDADDIRECPYCGRIMSIREKKEQGACDDCLNGEARR